MLRSVLHVDMDAFYASVEQRDRPELKGRPVIVGADPKNGKGRGVVAACSYEARKFGIRSALPISRAWKLCPQAEYVRARFKRYGEVSGIIMEIFRNYTNLVEPLSIDEAFLDVTGSIALMGPVHEIAQDVKRTICERTGLTASVGVAPNKFLAKIASDLQKPNGLVIVEPDQVPQFLADLPISRLWGVGPKTETRLRRMGVRTISDLSGLGRATLVQEMGAAGEHLWHLSRGEDNRPVVSGWAPKSISSETTFESDTDDRDRLVRTLRELSEQVARRLRKQKYQARTITLKLRYASFTTHTRQTTIPRPIETGRGIFEVAFPLFEGFPLTEKIRLIGVGAGHLSRDSERRAQLGLFPGSETSEKLAHTVDEIREKYGETSLQRGSELS